MASSVRVPRPRTRYFAFEMAMIVIACIAGIVLLDMAIIGYDDLGVQIAAGVTFTVALVVLIRLLFDPDSSNAMQTDAILKLASKMLDCLKDGLNENSAQQICQLLVPESAAIAVAITDRENILGYAGYNEEANPPGAPIRTDATHSTLEDGKPRVLLTREEIGKLPATSVRINAAIIMPIKVSGEPVGTLKFYYPRPNLISDTQKSMAQGFAELLSTQMAAMALEEQTKLATSMELKALQAQINPHFLFNTLNTIAAYIRTDPAKARTLLRDFASFYRSTIENGTDLIPFEHELDQVKRYCSFERARFGDDRLNLEINVEPCVLNMLVPSFMIQPLVENSVHHAMKAEGTLNVKIYGACYGDDVAITVIDDGKGMDQETLDNIMNPDSSSGLGIAVKNVCDRMHGYFGPNSSMEFNSKLGQGTSITFWLDRSIVNDYIGAVDDGDGDDDELKAKARA